MRYLKNFENDSYKKPFRKVDLQQLWDDFTTLQTKLVDKPILTDAYFERKILKDILQDKEIEFQRVRNPIDGEVTYNEGGRVKSIKLDSKDILRLKVICELYDHKEQWVLATIDNVSGFARNHKVYPQIVKIYNSEPIEIEEKIELLKATEKFGI